MSQRFCFISPFRSCHIDLKLSLGCARARGGGGG